MASTLARLRYTPLQDLLRGAVTGRLNWWGPIDSADEPPEVKTLIASIVRRTRLSRLEKADVAADLLAHFADGQEAGESTAELLATFGDARMAAKLFRRAKIHNRLLAQRLFRSTLWIFACLCLIYAGVATIYYSGVPSPKVNFVDVVNKQIAKTPQQQRAWPIYSSAIRAFGGSSWDPVLTHSGYGRYWPQIASWIDAHQPNLESVREASKLPALGLFLGESQSTASRGLVHVVPPGLRDLRLIATLLCLDAKRAREQRDGTRVEADISTLMNLSAQQKYNNQFRMSEAMSLHLLTESYDELDRTLVETPELLSDQALVRLAHRLSIPRVAGDLINFNGNQMVFEDVLQRTFTDDGHGDGRFSPDGWRFYVASFSQSPSFPQQMRIADAPGAVFQPFSILWSASRKELLAEYQRLIALNQATLKVPLRDADWNAACEEQTRLQCSLLLRWKYSLLLTVVPTMQNAAVLAERALGQRDGLLVGLALELHHRRHAQYPLALSELTPGLLPGVLADRITGDPLKYRLISGKPLVYSVGVNRVDDGGALPCHQELGAANDTAQWGPFAECIDGDWILYPLPRNTVEEAEQY